MDNIVYKYFNVSDSQRGKIDIMMDVYRFWNEKVNLISRKDFHYFYERHVLHSMAICKLFDFNHKSQIMDIGTGGGFPGVPLAIMFPEVSFYLVDSISKKTHALKSIKNELQLDNVNIVNMRAEHIDLKFDFIVSRAVSKIDKLIEWVGHKVSTQEHHQFQNGFICLKGGDLNQETKDIKHDIQTYLISDFFQEDFFQEKKILHLVMR
tara:strand:+ start:788 stop:1411 length:624 start_codon:yes stop_codon:yes gene_type:complete